jgi:hypothetical protein
MNRLNKSRHIILRIAIDKNDFISGVGKHFGDTVQTYCGAFMEIIAIRIIPADENN